MCVSVSISCCIYIYIYICMYVYTYICCLYIENSDIGVGTRGQWGHLPPQPAIGGGNAPTTRAILYVIYYLKFMNKKATKYALLVSSSLELRILHVSPRLLKVKASIVQKWAWSKNFHVRYRHSYILWLHNHKHLPTPMSDICL